MVTVFLTLGGGWSAETPSNPGTPRAQPRSSFRTADLKQ